MRIIVVGAGEVGTYIADRLSRQEHDIALIELDPERYRQIDAELDVLAINGSGTDSGVLKKAGIADTDLLVAATNKDEINLFSALLARQAGVGKTIVRVESRKLRSKEVSALFEKFDDHLVIDPDQEVADSVLRLMEYPGAMDLSRMANEEVVIIGARLPAHAPLVGVSLHALGRELDPDWDFIVGTITRKVESDDSEEVTIVPRQDEILKEGDLLRVICKSRALHDVTNRLGIARDVPRRALLLGGGRTAEMIAESLLYRGVDVAIIEKKHERALELSENLAKALIYEGDVTDVEMLEEADVARQDLVIALTGEDDANVLACLYAKSVSAQSKKTNGDDGIETIAVVHRLKLLDLLETNQVDTALSPRTATANSVLRFVRGDVESVAAVETFLHGDVEILEFAVSDESPCVDRSIGDMQLTKGALIGAIVRDGKAQIARGHSTFRANDHVIAIAKPESVEKLTALFV
ncbi:MAG: Trk system potassium transporter TrkA [Actinobacteria bacterium]|jgi:trk system potassium uptake protein TrkA|nr:Trk system potassium transporter TrkA [Actinomycetota bacterium]MCH2408277.1 Trk system potassium transporter TrkA [Acidimicrobiales bacterium]|tara:strand:- start:3146 stop:4549 length:1404 start_codon:yes stop_codon:yes gene_type:complete